MDNTEPFLQSTPCVQSDDAEIKILADSLWPESGRTDIFARNIQGYVRKMKQKSQPRSLDAKGILKSGGNWICAANANLAAALLRAKGVPSRTLAVIPTTGQRMEMHRIVECNEKGRWYQFDPSSLQAKLPLRARQNIIVATTSIIDVQLSMKPRMGAMIGCPYGHELEFFDRGLTLWGQDFFWTVARPLRKLDVDGPALRNIMSCWTGFIESGRIDHNFLKGYL